MNDPASDSRQTLESKFPRLFELCLEAKQDAANWFDGNLDFRLCIEHDLQKLDEAAWTVLKKKAAENFYSQIRWGPPGSRICQHRQLFDCLHEALGYIYLKQDGYQKIDFIPKQNGKKTPDLLASGGGKPAAVMEVKTVNESDKLRAYFSVLIDGGRGLGTAIAVDETTYLDEPFKRKLCCALRDACDQLCAGAVSAERRIAYFVIRPDFNVDANTTIVTFLRELSPPGIEIIVHFLPNGGW